MDYRPEIDGLRALAVSSVILFHAGFGLFSGGFVGVDVFFVISGYLITTILINDLEKNRFSIVDFYERRARRILPALFFVMLCCLPFAWIWMSPDSLRGFSQSLIAVSFFVSNVLFWRDSNYFDASAEEKPLLHTWSLAVEEQYYLLFPVFLFLAWRFGKNTIFLIILGSALLSYGLSEWASIAFVSGNFYLSPFRVWELLAGTIAAFIVHKHGIEQNNTLALGGLIAIICSIFIYDESTRFPSIYALLPVSGVVLLILYAGKNTLAAKILSIRLFVGIGLISYSAYLWHQPLFAFARIRLAAEPSFMLMLGLSILSLLLATLSWKYIEGPFRKKSLAGFSRQAIFSFSAAGLIFFTIIGLSGELTNGFDYRLTAQQRQLLSYENYDYADNYREGECLLKASQSHQDFGNKCLKPGTSIIWGDSHAAALASGWSIMDKNLSIFSSSNCPPLIGAVIASRPYCLTTNNFVLNEIRKNPGKHIYLHANWQGYEEAQLQRLDNTISLLKQTGVRQITIIAGIPHYSPSLPKRLMHENADLLAPHRSQADLKAVIAADEVIKGIAQDAGVSFISPVQAICDDGQCDSVINTKEGHMPISWDESHLTKLGALYLYQKLLGNDN